MNFTIYDSIGEPLFQYQISYNFMEQPRGITWYQI